MHISYWSSDVCSSDLIRACWSRTCATTGRKRCEVTTVRPKPSHRRTCGAERCRPTSQRANTASRCVPSMPGRANSARARPIGYSRYRSHPLATELPDDLPVKPFRTAAAWEKWLAAHRDARGIWLKIAKKDSGIASVPYAEALDVALCNGWIDGQKRGRSAEHTSELQSLMRISYAVFCLKQNNHTQSLSNNAINTT